MKKFKHLKFKEHPYNSSFSTIASINFKNGYGASIITGKGAYTNDKFPYELAVLSNGKLCYDTELTNDVIGFLDENGVSSLMEKIQNLK